MTIQEALDKLDKTVLRDLEWKIALTEALEKQIPKKPINIDYYADYAECPVCEGMCMGHLGSRFRFCKICGQKLDWN